MKDNLEQKELTETYELELVKKRQKKSFIVFAITIAIILIVLAAVLILAWGINLAKNGDL